MTESALQKRGWSLQELEGIALPQKSKDAVAAFLLENGISTLEEVEEKHILWYRAGHEGFCRSALEQCVYCWHLQSGRFAGLIKELEEYGKVPAKVVVYLFLYHIQTLNEIDYRLRVGFGQYLKTCRLAHAGEYVKQMDQLKLYAIAKQKIWKKPGLSNEPLFLGYYPDIEIANEFYYLRDKSDAVFDFSLRASQTVKRQIYWMLTEILQKKRARKENRQTYVLPLRSLYLFCAYAGVQDILLWERTDQERYREYLGGQDRCSLQAGLQMVERIQHDLFLRSPQIRWDATIWFLDRFRFSKERYNPAAQKRYYHFYLIVDRDNRDIFMAYMRYQIGVSQRSLTTVQAEYYILYAFLQLCEEKVTTIGEEGICRYLNRLEGNKPGTYNRKLNAICRFFRFLVVRGYRPRMPVEAAYYRRKAVLRHHDRSLTQQVQDQILASMKYLPEHLRLMYLHLCCSGLRISEVCCLKAGNYVWEKGTSWLRVWQNKMRTEKMIPIPEMLYWMMQEYIGKNNLCPDDYVFSTKTGQPYQRSTFYTQMNRFCIKYGIGGEDFHFRCHDLRHSVATNLYASGAPLQVVREFLGHAEEDMTKQYLDYIPLQVDEKNEAYFDRSPLWKGKQDGKALCADDGLLSKSTD